MLSAVLAGGQTVLENVAKEPHIVDLANFLNMMGADVRGAGTDVIKIRGREALHGCTYSIIPDQIEAGSYMIAAAITGGNVLIKNVIPKHLSPSPPSWSWRAPRWRNTTTRCGIPHGRSGSHQDQDHAAPRLPHGYAAAHDRAA